MAVGTGDLEGNGQGAIFAAQYGHTLRTFQNSSDNVYAEGVPTPLMMHPGNPVESPFARDMIVADTDGDGKKNVIVLVSNDYDPTVGILSIHAPDGSQVYAKITDHYLWGVSSGYFDNDGYLDMFVMNWAAPTLTVGWFEYDGEGYVYRKIILPERDWSYAGAVADTDGDGCSELLLAGIYDGQRQLLVLEAVSDNTARLREQVPYPSSSSPMDIDVGYVWDGGYPEIAVATHFSGGLDQVFFFRCDGAQVSPVCHTGSEFADGIYAFNTVDLTFVDGDGRADIVLTVGGLKALVLEALEEVVTYTPDIRANGTGGMVQLQRGEPLSVSAALTSKAVTGAPLELWLAAVRKRPAPARIFSFRHPGGWSPGLAPALTGKIANIGPLKVLQTDNLAPGSYNFYFGADLDPNGQLDAGSLLFDKVGVEIRP